MRNNGSIQNIAGIPQEIKDLYRTVWEMSMRDIIDMSRQRGYFIDQSQSLNLFMEGATIAKLNSMHFYAWKSGLKTGMYYLRTKAAANALQFTVAKKQESEPEVVQVEQEMTAEEFRAMIERSKNAGPEDCEMCGS